MTNTRALTSPENNSASDDNAESNNDNQLDGEEQQVLQQLKGAIVDARKSRSSDLLEDVLDRAEDVGISLVHPLVEEAEELLADLLAEDEYATTSSSDSDEEDFF